MELLRLRPELWELVEIPTLGQSDWRSGVVHGAYRDPGRRRIYRLVWLRASLNELAVYRYLWHDLVGGLNQPFLWLPPDSEREIVVRPVAPMRPQIATGRAVGFDWLLEEHHTADPAPWLAPFTPFWAPLLTPGAGG